MGEVEGDGVDSDNQPADECSRQPGETAWSLVKRITLAVFVFILIITSLDFNIIGFFLHKAAG